MKPEKLLFLYYQRTFRDRLGIDFPYHTNKEQKYSTLDNYLIQEYSSEVRTEVREKIEVFERITSPNAKLQPLRTYLSHNNDSSIKSLLDFGCGSGAITQLMAQQLGGLEIAYGVDIDRTILPKNIETTEPRKPLFLWSTDLTDIQQRNAIDIILVIHTLHHIGTSQDTLNALISLLNVNGIIYIYEDSWSSQLPLELSPYEDLDRIFLALSSKEKMDLFFRNEFWSNTWFYGRTLDTSIERYRSVEDWSTLLTSRGLSIVQSGVLGFDPKRLHGVPSSWIIAKKNT